MRKIYLSILLTISTVLGIILQLNSNPLALIFLISFNIICLIFYRRTRAIVAYHITTIFLMIGYFFTIYGISPDRDFAMLFSAFVDVGTFAIIIVPFIIILKNENESRIEAFMMITGVLRVIYYTSTKFQIMYYLEVFFYPNFVNVRVALRTFSLSNFVFLGIILIMQVYMIQRFDFQTRKEIRLARKHKQRVQEMFY